MLEETGKAFLIAWLILSAAIAPALCALYVLPSETLLAAAPVCDWKARYGRECAGCGLSRAFLRIVEGDYSGAAAYHRGAAPLFFALVANEAAALFAVGRMRLGMERLRCN